MLAANVTLESIITVVAAGQVANIALFWAFWNKVHKDFVLKSNCTLRDAGTREQIKTLKENGRSACTTLANRDEAIQARIDELVRSIATRDAEDILRDREILSKIDMLLARK